MYVCMTAGIVDESIIDFKTRRLGQSASDSVLKMKEVYIIIHTYIHTYIHTNISIYPGAQEAVPFCG